MYKYIKVPKLSDSQEYLRYTKYPAIPAPANAAVQNKFRLENHDGPLLLWCIGDEFADISSNQIFL